MNRRWVIWLGFMSFAFGNMLVALDGHYANGAFWILNAIFWMLAAKAAV